MVFNSFPFIVFFALFFVGYWFLFKRTARWQNFFLLVSCYIFYAWADYRFLLFLVGVSAFNYILGLQIAKENAYKKWFFYLGILQGILSLFLFKYLDFFIGIIQKALNLFNLTAQVSTLELVAPLGISFFTFRMLSYIIDINKGKLEATKDPLVFFSYVAYFPSLLSGPIDKAQLLIPQLQNVRRFDYDLAVDGLRQFLWGLFKKVVVADTCASFTSIYFESYFDYGASTLLLAAMLFTIQIYADFSGYSDMAIGISKVMGLNITKNFNYPFFAQNIAELWRRWHISLTAWLTEYVFTPLSIAFRDWGNAGLILAILVNFLLVGMWHGANWTYVVFGLMHGVFYIPLILSGKMNKRKKLDKNRKLPSFKELLHMLLTFFLFMLSMIVFRSKDISGAWAYFSQLIDRSILSLPNIPISRMLLITAFLSIAVMFVVEWVQRNKDHGLVLDRVSKPAYRLLIYYGLLFVVIRYGAWANSGFIYFKF